MTGHNLIENIEIEVDRDGEIRFYKVDVMVNWTFDPGLWSYSNGDPGYPSSFDYDFDIIHAYEVQENGELHELGIEYYNELYSEVGGAIDNMDDDTIMDT